MGWGDVFELAMYIDVIGVDVKRSLIFTIARRRIDMIDAVNVVERTISSSKCSSYQHNVLNACDVDREPIKFRRVSRIMSLSIGVPITR